MAANNLHRCSLRLSICNCFLLILVISSMLFLPDFLNTAYAEEKFYSIQIGAYRRLDDAVNMANNLKRQGRNAFYRYETIKGKGKWHRVYIERFGSREDAKKEAKRLMKLNLISDYIIRTLNDEEKNVQKNESEKKTDAEESEPPLVIKDITVRIEEGVKETVFIHSNRFIKPLVFALEGERPRSVIDIKDTITFRKDLSKIVVNGELIKQIRTHLYHESKTLRVVLDHYPSKSYIVNQIFYKKENIYALEVVAKEETEQKEEQQPKEETEPKEKREAGEAERIVKKDEQRQLAYIPRDIEQGKIELRRKGEDMTGEDVRAMLLKYDFYSSCWTYNGDFCNPYGGFDNFFISNGDGTVTDHATNLMWQKSGSLRVMTWEETKEYVQQLNHQGFAGHSDWRLPTVEELASLMERSWKNEDLFIETVFDTKQKSCWSADTHGPGKVWKTNFYLGYIIDTPLTYKNSVRAVR